ncbi:MAG: MATE family efflux transporter [Planctomycetota bacterium]|nr:MATE family efflux transporter [Planctomycetota bacterium]
MFVQKWWSRPCGGRDVLRIALPLVVSTASWTVMNFCDRMFLLRHSTEEMAAALPAGMLYFASICFPLGVAIYVNTFVAQYKGAGHSERIGLAVWQGVWVGMIAAPLYLLAIPLAPYIFQFAQHGPVVAHAETVYYQVLTCGAGAAIVAGAFSSFFTGRGATRVVMFVDMAAAVLNVALDYILIFGKCGAPEMGIAGAAWGTVVAQWFRVLLYWRLVELARYRETYQIRAGCRWDMDLLKRLLRFGSPNGLQLLVEISAFTVFLLLVGRLGKEAMASTTLAFNVNSVAFVPMLGMGIAVSTIVGQQLGKNKPDLAARATWTALVMAVFYMGSLSVMYVVVPDWFMLGHASLVDAERFAVLRDTVVVLLRFVAAYCLFDAMVVVFVSAIKGAGDTRFVLLTQLVVAQPPVLAAWAGITYFGFGLIYCWLVLTVWISALGMIYLGRFLQGRWRTMRVIEADMLLGEAEDQAPAHLATLPGSLAASSATADRTDL